MEIEPYQSPRRSKLFEHEELIREMRAKNWPLSEIAKKLKTEHHLQTAVPTLHAWCKRNGIVKGQTHVSKTTASAEPSQPSETALLAKSDDEIWRELVSPSAESKSPFSKPLNK